MDEQAKITDDALLTKINVAVAAANEAEKAKTETEKTAWTARAEFVSRSKAVGLLLNEAHELHPTKKDFEAFLKRVHGLHVSRAYDLMRLAGGRVTDEQLKKETRDRVKKHRASKKKLLPKPAPALKEPEPKSESVTSDVVTDFAEARTEKHKPEKLDADEKAESARALDEFGYACRHWLPKMSAADQHRALQLVNAIVSPKAEAA